MTGLDYVALAMIGFSVVLAIAFIVFLGKWPGRVAAERSHPYRSAVAVGGWITLFAGGIFWPLVLIWAYAGIPDDQISSSKTGAAS